jgi:hypothetical protein
MDMKESKFFWSRKRSRGQSIVEFAMMAPILLILLSGLFEFGFIFMHYLAILDSARNAARFSSDSQFDITDGISNCDSSMGPATKDFYRQTACLAVAELAQEQPTITLCMPGAPTSRNCPGAPGAHNWNGMDDVIVSVFSVLRTSGPTIVRFPSGVGDMGWSYDADLKPQSQGSARTGMHVSQFSTARVLGMLRPGTPNTGYVLVEINYNYHQILALPWFTQFVHDPVQFHLYSMWPLVSAEPTSTPK